MRILWTVLATTCCLFASSVTGEMASLEKGFDDPPASAKPWAYWWWLDSNASKEGITRDLEEMNRQGIAGALVFDAGEGKGSPVGPRFMSQAWRDLFKHALSEADRLGIELSANLCSGWNAGGTWVTPEHAAKWLVWSSDQVQGGGRVSRDLPRPEVRGDFYRDIAVLAFPEGGRPAGAPGLKNFDFKAARIFLTQIPDVLFEEDAGTPGERDCQSKQVIDLSGQMDSNGRLTWDAPTGAWTVLRLGYTLLGAKTSCASVGSQGLEIDFLSRQAMDLHWGETGAKMLADAGPLAGKTLTYVHDDSYEVAGPNRTQLNWTPEFRDEFRKRRGYDLLPYLPVLAGKIVDNREVSNRFLWDYRRTIGDLFADGHYRRMRDLARQHGVGTHPESGGPFWPYIDALELVGINDVPMGEYWKRVPEKPDGKIMWADPGNYAICDTVKQAATAAHIYGKRVCQAEAWTSMGPNWEEDLFDLKDIGDKALCAGLTRNMLCFYVHQPRLDILPGYQWEAAGTHFDRNVTWWDMSHAWLKYLARCQHLLQQGLFVADFCYFYGEDVPNYVPVKTQMRPPLPKGFDCDTINADVLLNRLAVKDGRLVLPDGMSYGYLVLPHRSPATMSVKVLKRVKELVEAGATVIGPEPERAPGLTDYPACDEGVRRIAAELWGDSKGQDPRIGKGRIITEKGLRDILLADGLKPDFKYSGQRKDAALDYIHRAGDGVDIYFIANQLDRSESAECLFRVSGRQPEIWDAVTGERRDAAEWHVTEGRTVMHMQFAPRQSLFVVFRREVSGAERETQAGKSNFPALSVAEELAGPWTVRFDPKWGGPESVVFEQLVDWTTRPEEGIKYYSGKAVYEKTFDLPEALRQTGKRIHLDLGKLKNVAEVRLNGKELGVVWTAPWRVEITSAMQPAGNQLEIGVVNLWPNRLIGDSKLPEAKRLTVTNVKKFKPDSPLLPSGLMGPVTLQACE